MSPISLVAPGAGVGRIVNDSATGGPPAGAERAARAAGAEPAARAGTPPASRKPAAVTPAATRAPRLVQPVMKSSEVLVYAPLAGQSGQSGRDYMGGAAGPVTLCGSHASPAAGPGGRGVAHGRSPTRGLRQDQPFG